MKKLNNKQTNKHIFRACVQKFLFEIHSSAKGMSFHFPFSLNALVKTIFLNFRISPLERCWKDICIYKQNFGCFFSYLNIRSYVTYTQVYTVCFWFCWVVKSGLDCSLCPVVRPAPPPPPPDCSLARPSLYPDVLEYVGYKQIHLKRTVLIRNGLL